MCTSSNDGGACWPPEATIHDEDGDASCVPEPAGQACDKATQRCTNVCEPGEYMLVCRSAPAPASSAALASFGSATPIGPSPIPTPDPSLGCGSLRVSVYVPPNQTFYCCRCAAE
jgi:hypothetical protein